MMKSDRKKNRVLTTPDSVLAYSAAGEGSPLQARLLGSGCSGIFELVVFHPVDTVAKRLMSSVKSVRVAGDMTATVANANQVVFRDAANLGIIGKWKSMFPGLGFAAGYKIMQRTYKFGGQPYVKDYMSKNHGDKFTAVFGKKSGKIMMDSTAGAMMGIGEVALLPLDVLKIKAQTNPDSLKGRGVVDIFMTEGRGLYRGAGWTAARNAPGSFALFGGNSLVHSFFPEVPKGEKKSFFQFFCGSIGGAISSITVAAPLDVVKTRIQNRPFDAPESGVTIIRNMIKNEGMGSFFKGLTPKIVVVGPKLIFSFTIAQQLIAYFEKTL